MAWFRAEKGDAVGYPDFLLMRTTAATFNLSDTKTQANKIPAYAFYDSYYLQDIDAPPITNIDDYAFAECNNVRNIALPDLTRIGEHALSCKRAPALRSTVNINLPKLTTIADFGFFDFGAQNSNTALEFPKVTSIGESGFGCSNSNYAWTLKALILSFSAGVIFDYAVFAGATIGTIDCAGECSFADNALLGGSITNLVLRDSHMSTLAVGGSLGTAPAHIYVNDDLVTSYQNDDDWSQYASIIESIENFTPDY